MKTRTIKKMNTYVKRTAWVALPIFLCLSVSEVIFIITKNETLGVVLKISVIAFIFINLNGYYWVWRKKSAVERLPRLFNGTLVTKKEKWKNITDELRRNAFGELFILSSVINAFLHLELCLLYIILRLAVPYVANKQ